MFRSAIEPFGGYECDRKQPELLWREFIGYLRNRAKPSTFARRRIKTAVARQAPAVGAGHGQVAIGARDNRVGARWAFKRYRVRKGDAQSGAVTVFCGVTCC